MHRSLPSLLLLLAGCESKPSNPDAGSPWCSTECSCEDAGAPVAGWDDRLGPWLRRLQVQSAQAASPSPVAWSMINQACQNRSLLLQLGLLLAKDPTQPPLVLKERELTDSFLAQAITTAAVEVGSLTVTGPLMVDQCLLDPGGAPYSMQSMLWYWAYHSVPTVKVNGEWMVFDLSVGDRPVKIDAWLQNVVAPPLTCQKTDQATFNEVWAYWNVVLGSAWDPPAQRPSPPCAYVVAPALALREGADPLYEVVRTSPLALEPQTEAFKTLVESANLASVSFDQLAQLTTRYHPLTEKAFCARPWIEAKYCATVK